MKILYISNSHQEDDRCEWSGTVYQTIQGLKRVGFDVDYLDANRDYKQTFLDKVICTYWLRIPSMFGKQTRMDESYYNVRRYRQTLQNFDYSPYDIVFVPTHISIVAALPKNINAKIVHLVDATVDSLFDYYTEFSNLWFHNYWEAHFIGKKAFLRSDLIIASSDWCKKNAVKNYGCDPSKVEVVEFGANIDIKDVPAIPKQLDGKDHLNIYWSGVNWERKGGDVALSCCEELIKRGYYITFHVTGLKIDSPISFRLATLPYVVNHGFLSKNVKEDYDKLVSIMREQDIFLFPSKAECSSIALCEANGFGLPCYVYDTGGTGNYVINGENGYMLPLSAKGNEFADVIESSIKNHQLNALSIGAVDRYKSHLNWNVWCRIVKYLLYKIVN